MKNEQIIDQCMFINENNQCIRCRDNYTGDVDENGDMTSCTEDTDFLKTNYYVSHFHYGQFLSVNRCADSSKMPFIHVNLDDLKIMGYDWE